jgi:hypothetical protein
MMFLKYLCCKERLSATVKTGDLLFTPGVHTSPTLMIHISLSMTQINPATDFLYLSQLHENHHQLSTSDPHAPHVKSTQGAGTSTASTTAAT